MFYKAIFSRTGYTETVCIINEQGFKAYSEICNNALLTIDFQAKTIIVHEK